MLTWYFYLEVLGQHDSMLQALKKNFSLHKKFLLDDISLKYKCMKIRVPSKIILTHYSVVGGPPLRSSRGN